MVSKTNISLEEAIARETGALAKLTLQYTLTMKQILDSAKDNPDFSNDSWGPLAEFVDVDRFHRVGTFLEEVNWADYVPLLTDWSRYAYWQPRVRRVTEQDGVVFLELAESTTYAGQGDKVEGIHSVSVYEYDADHKLVLLDIYMQRKLEDFPNLSWVEAS